ncbi:hypothetical protein [Clostridium psychrophilum]|uniref:hypothetical protein n=1 Tax=Clostridium psychrophilum TaxID=132926 RepID=UPI001FEA87D2|nr:hypothetical protein [Clostridium psychrophilum]
MQCPFLSTTEENVECFKECDLHKWHDSAGECPFVELQNCKPLNIDNVFNYDFFGEDKSSPLRMLYKDKYI